MLREVAKNLSTKTKHAISQLPIGGFFFTCRSYTYVLVPQAERNRTDILRLRNFFFFKDGIELKQDNPQLEFADCVSIIFEWQKRDNKMGTVTKICSDDMLLCQVRIWIEIVRSIWGYRGGTWVTPVLTV